MKTPAVLLGLAIGDALGAPFEFCSSKWIINSGWNGEFRDYKHGYENMFKFKAGQWTDDTKMSLCLAESLVEKLRFDLDDVASKYLDWFKSGDLRGIGKRTTSAMLALSNGVSPKESGKKSHERKAPVFKRIGEEKTELSEDGLHGIGDFCGNGTVMRCAPLGVFYRDITDVDLLIKSAKKDATITHDHPDARDSSVFLSCMISHLVEGLDPDYSLAVLVGDLNFPIRASDYEYDHVPRLVREAMKLASDEKTTFVDAIPLGIHGTAHETLATALFCFLKYKNFKEAVCAAVLMGGDADTRAAITGALAGAYYGLEGIPEEYVKQVELSDHLQELDKKLYEELL